MTDRTEEDYVALATKEGWNENYDGANAKTAQEFVEAGEQIAGIAVKKSRALEGKVEQLEENLAKMQVTQDTLARHHKHTVDRERQDRASEVTALEVKLSEALTNGEGDAHGLIGKQIADLKAQPEPGDGAEVSAAWAAKETWYTTDQVAKKYADVTAAELSNSDFKGTQAQFMAEVTRIVKKDLPERFENPKRTESMTEGNEGIEPEPAGDRSYKSLDAEAKAICDRLVSEGVLDKEQYLNDYYGE